ncbi:hypothetical protein, partial [Vibrio coralliirubri]|uniref:hypothetical protein n=1 Tax=Vibrio coralliirubri TaxID=1516159 RepID=UPI000B23D143
IDTITSGQTVNSNSKNKAGITEALAISVKRRTECSKLTSSKKQANAVHSYHASVIQIVTRLKGLIILVEHSTLLVDPFGRS